LSDSAVPVLYREGTGDKVVKAENEKIAAVDFANAVGAQANNAAGQAAASGQGIWFSFLGIDWSTPTWDVVILLFIITSVLVYSFTLGRDRIVALLISTYLALAVTTNLPYMDRISDVISQTFLGNLQLPVFIVVFILLFILFTFYSQSRKVKTYSLTAMALIIVFVGLVFSFPQSRLVTGSPILSTITQISSKALTFQTRLISWKAAIKDFSNYPLLGTGYGNFAISFEKYFDPRHLTQALQNNSAQAKNRKKSAPKNKNHQNNFLNFSIRFYPPSLKFRRIALSFSVGQKTTRDK